jgi:hypothetical protein
MNQTVRGDGIPVQEGVVSTLCRVELPGPEAALPASPALRPFPSLAMNREGDCNALQNVDAIEVGYVGSALVLSYLTRL